MCDGRFGRTAHAGGYTGLYAQPVGESGQPDSGMPEFRRAGGPGQIIFRQQVHQQVFRYLLGLSVSDTQTGLRAIPAAFMKKLMEVRGERFEYETNMLIETKNLNIPILEVPVKNHIHRGEQDQPF